MTWMALFWHTFHFAAPALALGAWMGLCAPFVLRRPAPMHQRLRHTCVNTALGLTALGVAWVIKGHDGSMLGYAALVITVALSEWVQYKVGR